MFIKLEIIKKLKSSTYFRMLKMKNFSFLILYLCLLDTMSNYDIKNIGYESTNDFFSLDSALEYVNNVYDPNYKIWLQILSSNSEDLSTSTRSISVACDCLVRYFALSYFLFNIF